MVEIGVSQFFLDHERVLFFFFLLNLTYLFTFFVFLLFLVKSFCYKFPPPFDWLKTYMALQKKSPVSQNWNIFLIYSVMIGEGKMIYNIYLKDVCRLLWETLYCCTSTFEEQTYSAPTFLSSSINTFVSPKQFLFWTKIKILHHYLFVLVRPWLCWLVTYPTKKKCNQRFCFKWSKS